MTRQVSLLPAQLGSVRCQMSDVDNDEDFGVPGPLVDLHGAVGDGLDLGAAHVALTVKALPLPAGVRDGERWISVAAGGGEGAAGQDARRLVQWAC